MFPRILLLHKGDFALDFRRKVLERLGREEDEKFFIYTVELPVDEAIITAKPFDFFISSSRVSEEELREIISLHDEAHASVPQLVVFRELTKNFPWDHKKVSSTEEITFENM